MKQSILVMIFSVLTLLLTSCGRIPSYITDPSVRHLNNQQTNDLYYTEHTGIQVIKQGMRFTFVIPVDCFFVKQSRELKSHRFYDLMILSRFIRSYLHYFAGTRVSVIGYTDVTLLKPARNHLSKHYADVIAAELVENGVPVQALDVGGEGASNPVASNAYPMGASFNRRVVIIIH